MVGHGMSTSRGRVKPAGPSGVRGPPRATPYGRLGGCPRLAAVADLNIPSAPVVEGARHLHSGKVRDLYELTEGEHAGRLLMVASDRISAFDFVLETPIPDKGEILTRMSLWWFGQLADLVPNHVVSPEVPAAVRGRAVVCERLEMFP